MFVTLNEVGLGLPCTSSLFLQRVMKVRTRASGAGEGLNLHETTLSGSLVRHSVSH